jgi:hypothetical protein
MSKSALPENSAANRNWPIRGCTVTRNDRLTHPNFLRTLVWSAGEARIYSAFPQACRWEDAWI